MWYPKERADLKMIHDENEVLTGDELVIVRGILRAIYTKQISSWI